MGKRTERASDFPVDTNGHCFICLNKTLPDYKNKSGSVSVQPFASLQSLSQYLKMDMTKVFHEKESIKSRLKVSLCEQCAGWNDKITSLCRKLEKIETEVSFYLELIRGSLLGSSEDDKTGLFCKLGDDQGLLEKVRIMMALRTEAKERCSQKLTGVHPRVKVRNLTSCQVFSIEQRNKSKARRNATPTIPHFLQSPTNLCDSDRMKNEELGTDAIDYFEENDNALDGVYEDESNNSVDHLHHAAAGSPPPPSITQTRAVEVKRRKRVNNTTVENSSTKVFPPNSSIKVEKLTIVINPKTGKFKCNICSGEFTERGTLKRHYDSIHLKIKHKCNLCGKEFDQLSNYKIHHKIVHVGVRYKCNLCGSCFRQKHGLNLHHQTAHLGKRYQCLFCSSSFAQKSYLARHVRSLHQDVGSIKFN